MSFLTLWEMKEYAERCFSSNKTNIQLMPDVLCLQLFLFLLTYKAALKQTQILTTRRILFFGFFLLKVFNEKQNFEIVGCRFF